MTVIRDHHGPVHHEDDLASGVILPNQIALENANDTDFTADGAEIVADAMLALGVSDETYEEATEASQTRFENLIELFD